jgi:hypothetical protein
MRQNLQISDCNFIGPIYTCLSLFNFEQIGQV